MKENPTFIISRTDAIGDVILTLPMMGFLKEKFPLCKIVFMGKTYTQAIANCSQHIDLFVNIDELFLLSWQQQIETIKALKADFFIHVFPNRHLARLARLAKIPTRIGTSHRWFHWLYCNARVNYSRRKSDLHEAQLNFKLLKPIQIEHIPSLELIHEWYGMTKSPVLSGSIQKLIVPGKFNLILHPRSHGSAREWGLDNFSQLIDLLPKDIFAIFITGTVKEKDSLLPFLEKHSNKVIDLISKLSLEEFIGFIGMADGLVAASTGPLHIAAALGKHAIGIYPPIRPIHPGRWAPLGKNASFFVINKKCELCRNGSKCLCILQVKPADVANELILKAEQIR